MRGLRPAVRVVALPLVTLMLGAALASRPAGAQGPAVGAWATYEWRSAVEVDVPVFVQQPGAAGAPATWSVEREKTAPRPFYVTYGIVRGDAKSYVLQILTRLSPDGPPLSITQVTVDRASGKALKSVIRDKKGIIATPESGVRPFREAAVAGRREEVAVPAGRFTAVRAPHGQGTVWVSDKVPALGLVKAVSPQGQLELVRSGTTGARDLLRS
jgi:hypothetical protein